MVKVPLIHSSVPFRTLQRAVHPSILNSAHVHENLQLLDPALAQDPYNHCGLSIWYNSLITNQL
jgi:hypothetical protein